MDVEAALGAGAKAVAVCTGVFKRSELDNFGDGVIVLDNLQDTAAVMDRLVQAQRGAAFMSCN